jgi:hypothetical protein
MRPRPFTLLFSLALIASLLYASYGYSRVNVERTWSINNSKGIPAYLQAALSVNSTSQKIISVDLAPGMTQEMRDGVLWVTYNHTPDTDALVLRADVVAEVNYDPHILSDTPVSGTRLNATNLTEADDGIRMQARSLAKDDSSLETIRSVTQWVYENVAYDLSYWGKSEPATTVFRDRRGVCVEYTHLLISMMRSLGFDTRYVSGYVYSDGWQQHAWAEVLLPGYGWLPVDPTFDQVGVLDSTHFGMYYGQDQSDIYDSLFTSSDNVSLDASNLPYVLLVQPDPKGANISVSTNNDTSTIDVTISNSRHEFMFGRYFLNLPNGYGPDSSEILLLQPDQSVHRFKGLNRSLFKPGYTYTIPITASFNDATAESTLRSDGFGSGQQVPQNQSPSENNAICAPALVALALLPLLAYLVVVSVLSKTKKR